MTGAPDTLPAPLRRHAALGPAGPNRRRRVLQALGLVAALLSAGCATVWEGRLEPSLFPPLNAASAPPLAGRVALVLPPALREQTHGGPPEFQYDKRMRLPLGPIVDTALQRQLGAAFGDGVQLSAVPPPAGSGFDLTVSVAAVQMQFSNHLNYVIPVPVPPFIGILAQSTDHTVRMTLDLRITDAFGRLLDERTIDTGPLVEERGLWMLESGYEFYLRRTHVAAWQAAALAAKAACDALHAERLRTRPL